MFKEWRLEIKEGEESLIALISIKTPKYYSALTNP
jgi:hypothetical protein